SQTSSVQQLYNPYGCASFAYIRHLSIIAPTSGRQDPHPVPAPVVSHRRCISVQPSLIFFSRLPSPTWLQLHTSRPITGSLMSPLRSSCNLFSLSSVLLAIRSLNSTNSFLSPISIAPTSRS